VYISTTRSWATVSYQDQRLGVAPGRFSLPIGARTLRFAPAGDASKAFEREVQVTRTPSTLRVPL